MRLTRLKGKDLHLVQYSMYLGSDGLDEICVEDGTSSNGMDDSHGGE
jgi:hypothetical protein